MILGAPEPAGHLDAVFGLSPGDRVLLVRNERTMGGRRVLLWDLPGGRVEAGEALEEALRREWREETGLACRVGDLLLVVDGAKRRREGAPPLYTWRAFFCAVESDGDPVCGPGIDAAEWVDRVEAAARLDGPYHGPLRRLLAGGTKRHDRVQWIDPGPDAGDEPAADRLRRLLVLGATAAHGDLEVAAQALRDALDEGVNVSRLEETLLQVVPYAGFPRAIAAWTRLRPLLGDPPPREEVVEPIAPGYEVFDAVYGEAASGIRERLRGLHPELERWTLAFAYGRVLARPPLTLLERELLAVAILTALGRLEAPLLGHMRAARRLGASAEDVAAAIQAVPVSLGPGRREAARALLARL